MNIKKIITILMILSPFAMSAQSLTSVWERITLNNLTLKAVQQQMEAERVGNRVGLSPANPEFEFAYLWGSPDAVGNRIDVSVTQSFEFPTTYVYRSRIANLKNEQLQFSYRKQCADVMRESGEVYYEIVSHNVRIKDMERCLAYLSEASASYQQKLDAGTINIFDYNKVRLAELNMQQELARAVAERENLLMRLRQLNGGEAVEVSAEEFPTMELAPDFDSWFKQVAEHDPELLWIESEQAVQRQQLKLDKSSWAPQFFAGYMREQVPSETFQGVKVGISVPLWQNLNTIKQSQWQTSALTFLAADQQHRYYNELKGHHTMASYYQKQIAEYEQLLASVDAAELLQQALASGRISIIDYLYELSVYHESHERLAELQRDAALEYVELQVASAFAR